MLGCQQWNGEPEAGRGSRCRKREVLGDLEGRQRRRTGQGIIIIYQQFINKGEPSTMDHLTQLLDWSSTNYMNVNIKKTKEIIICQLNSNVFSPLRVADVEIERVDIFKLLGVYIYRSLKWDERVRSICNKAASRIHFLKQLKRSSVGPDDLFHFYATMIRPVLEYAWPVWHSGLTFEHRNRIEAIQKRVFRIIFDTSDYLEFCTAHSYSILHERRDLLCRQFFQSVLDKSNPTAWSSCCLNCDQMVLKIDCATHPFLSCPVCALHVLSRLLLTMLLITMPDLVSFWSV